MRTDRLGLFSRERGEGQGVGWGGRGKSIGGVTCISPLTRGRGLEGIGGFGSRGKTLCLVGSEPQEEKHIWGCSSIEYKFAQAYPRILLQI